MNPKIKPTESGRFRRVAEGLYVYEQTELYFCRIRHKGSRVFERLGTDRVQDKKVTNSRRACIFLAYALSSY
jgi:hypothetical protein